MNLEIEERGKKMQKFHVIAIQNKKVFFKAKDNEEGFEWTGKRNDGIWFNSEEQATRFAQRYFTKFKNWEVRPVYYDDSK